MVRRGRRPLLRRAYRTKACGRRSTCPARPPAAASIGRPHVFRRPPTSTRRSSPLGASTLQTLRADQAAGRRSLAHGARRSPTRSRSPARRCADRAAAARRDRKRLPDPAEALSRRSSSLADALEETPPRRAESRPRHRTESMTGSTGRDRVSAVDLGDRVAIGSARHLLVTGFARRHARRRSLNALAAAAGVRRAGGDGLLQRIPVAVGSAAAAPTPRPRFGLPTTASRRRSRSERLRASRPRSARTSLLPRRGRGSGVATAPSSSRCDLRQLWIVLALPRGAVKARPAAVYRRLDDARWCGSAAERHHAALEQRSERCSASRLRRSAAQRPRASPLAAAPTSGAFRASIAAPARSSGLPPPAPRPAAQPALRERRAAPW